MKHTFKCLLLSIVFLSAPSAYSAGGYEGERNAFNRFHGKGTYKYTNGNTYTGEWKDGRKSGKGTQVWANGDKYEGQWSENRQNGQGTMNWENGDEYVGQWAGGKRHGKGAMKFADGSSYDGEWIKNKRNGFGEYTSAKGDAYKGQWEADKRQGQGTLTLKNGTKIVGAWDKDYVTGDANVSFADGSRYTGPTKGNKPNGKGVCKKSGNLFPCEYRAGVLQVAKKPKPKPKPAPVVKKEPPKPKPAPVVKKETPKPKPVVVKKPEPVKPKSPLAGTAKGANPSTSTVKAVVEKAKPAVPVKVNPLAGTAKGANPSSAKKAAPAAAPAPVEVEETKSTKSKPRGPRGASLNTGHDSVEAIAALIANPPAAGSKFSFAHNWEKTGQSALNNAWVERDVNQIGDLKIRAEGDYVVVLMIDEYFGPGEYQLKYFKGTITKPGVASYQTTSSQPGKVTITEETDTVIKGVFEFKGYRNGSPVTGESRIVQAGQFVLPKGTN